MKKSLAVIVVLMLVLSLCLAGCGSTTAPDASAGDKAAAGGEITIGYVTMDQGTPYFVNVIEGMQEAADAAGAKLSVYDPKWDSAQQVALVENLITSGATAIIISPIDPVAVESAMKAAQEKGIRVVGLNTPIEGADANITVDEYQYGFEGGKLAGEWIRDKLGGEAEFAVLGAPDLKQLIDRQKGLEEGVLSVAPNAKLVSTQPGNTLELGMKAAETILQANPNVKVMVAVADAGALGAMEGVKGLGKATDDFYVGGLDATDEALTKMKEEGSIYRATVDLDPPGAGRLTVETTLKVIKDGPISEYIYMQMAPVKQS